MQLDAARVAALLFLLATLAAACAVAWTWQAQQSLAGDSAARAMAAVDERLTAMEHQVQRIAALPELASPLASCPDTLVQALLHESLNSTLLRRLEVVERGNPWRCGPQGQRPAEPPRMPPAAGMSLLLGGQIAAVPELMQTLSDGRGVSARLDAHALRLPQDFWPAGVDATALHVTVRSADGGSLPLWGPRRVGSPRAVVLQARSFSPRHQVSVSVEVDRAGFAVAAARCAASTVGLVLLLALAALAWVWRRAVLQSRLVYRLTHALRKRQFEPFVQPIVDLQTGRCIGGEVLMRWNHPQRGILGPAEFIDEAERTGLIVGMSDLTMSLAAHRLAGVAQANAELYFSFNVTPGQLREPGFATRLGEIFRADTVPRHQVLLELTERDFVDPRAKGTLIALRADGWRIAIDDFGTGQSSLSTIESLPIDRIKVDRAFVSTIDDKTVNRPVLDAIIQLARDLNIPLIAEGVETRSQWDYLASRGVASAQGFLMAKPMATDDFMKWLHDPASARFLPQHNAPAQAATWDSAALQTRSDRMRLLWQGLSAASHLLVADRTHRLRVYPRCFVGRHAVDWMVATLGISRKEAVHQGRALLAAGLVSHVLDEHDFEDDGYFYRLAAATAAAAIEPLPEALAGKLALQRALDFPWQSHSQGVLRHHQCTTGRSLVDWIVQRHGVSRDVALRWGTHWMRQGALRHVMDMQPFRDDKTLYRLG